MLLQQLKELHLEPEKNEALKRLESMRLVILVQVLRLSYTATSSISVIL